MLNLKRIITAMVLWPAAVVAQDISFDVKGENSDLAAALRSASLVLATSADENPDPQDYIAAARADYRRLLTALYGRGYYSGVISISVDGREASSIAPLAAPARINAITLRVDPGPVFRFGDTDISPTASGTLLPESFARGQTAAANVVGQAVTAAVDAWRDTGHAKAARIGQSITAQHAAQELNVRVAIAPGPQLTFGDMSVTGNAAVRTDRIVAIAGLPVGETFSPAALKKAEQRLRETGAFDSVTTTEAKVIGPNDTLPIVLNVAERKPRRFGFGLELSSIEGIKVSSFWLHRNFLGGAERFRVDGEISGIGGETGGVDYTINLNLERPAVYGPDTDGFIRSQLSREDEPDYRVDQFAIEAGLTRVIADDLVAEIGVGFLTARDVTDLGTRDYTLVTFPISATLDRRDVPTNATDGYYLDLETTPFFDTANDVVGARMFADARAYRSVGADEQLTLAGRLQVGSLLGTSIQNTPADFLFYSGGGGTVRGQPYKSLAIDDLVGGQAVRTGGQSFVGAQLEARYAVSDTIGLVGFYDVGQVSADAGFDNNTGWHAGAGVGIRYNTGIGPIRLDIGTPASGANIAKSVQVYIGIGQSF
ncbi:MAG: BamA/TamA family outer membrane protein [Yoonia sp.]